jgi:hypothetical protein
MSTRSHINIVLPDNSVKSIYVHSDGYPDGVGHCLINNFNSYEKAIELFNYGDASYLGDTIDECSFYHRDWKRDLDKARLYKNEWLYMNAMKGEEWHIEFIYLFKEGQWFVSSSESIDVAETSLPMGVYDDVKYLSYYSEFVPVKEHRHFTGKKNDHSEVKMLGQIMNMFKQAGFDEDKVTVQGGKLKKSN